MSDDFRYINESEKKIVKTWSEADCELESRSKVLTRANSKFDSAFVRSETANNALLTLVSEDRPVVCINVGHNRMLVITWRVGGSTFETFKVSNMVGGDA